VPSGKPKTAILLLSAILALGAGAGGVLLFDRLTGQDGLDRDSSRRAAELTIATSDVATEAGLLLRELESSSDGLAVGSDPDTALDRLAKQAAEARGLARKVERDLPSDAPERDALAGANRDIDRATREVVDSGGGRSRSRAPSQRKVRDALAEIGDVSREVNAVAVRLRLDDDPGLKERLISARGRLPRNDVDVLREANMTLTGETDGSLAGSGVAGVGDVDGDDQPDVAVAAQGEATVYVLPGDQLASSGGEEALEDSGFSITSIPFDDPNEILKEEGEEPSVFPDLIDLAPAGDVNGDGLADIVIGASSADEDAGVAYVVFGSRSGSDVDLERLGSRGYAIKGPGPFWRAGTSVTGVGDVNGDGRDDLAVGGRRQFGDSGTTAATGLAVTWVLLGGAERDELRLPKNGGPEDGFMIDGFGDSLARVGDVNGDGLDDVAGGDAWNRMGLPGSAGVAFGTREPPDTIDVSEAGDWGIYLDTRQGRLMGGSVSAAGDQDGDGLDDIAVGSTASAPADDFDPFPEQQVAVVYGSRSPGRASISSLGEDGVQLDGVGPFVAGVGDLNGDAVEDLAVETSRQIEGAGPSIGGARVFFGGGEPPNAGSRSPGFAIEGAGVTGPTSEFSTAGRAGSVLAGAGDVDGDGRGDLLVGAPLQGTGETLFHGAAYLLLAEPPPVESSPLAGSVSAAGFGPTRVGSSASAAAQELGTEVGSRLDSCAFLEMSDDRVSFLVQGDTVARVQVSGPGYATEEGIEVGDSEASVRAAYGDRIERAEHEYAPDGSYLTVATPEPRVPGAKIVFETNGEAVTYIRAGREPEVGYVEGCA